MKNYDKDKKSSYIQYLDANNLYEWAMSQKLPVNGFGWVKYISNLNEKLEKSIKLIKNYDEDSDKAYILEGDIKYPKDLHDLHSDLAFLSERMKINKCNKLVFNLYDKKIRYSYKNFKQALNHGLVLKKVHRVIQFNQEAWLKPYIDMNTKLRKEAKMNNAVFRKTMENVRKHKDIKLVTTNKRRNYLVSEPSYHVTKWFSEGLLVIEMKKK